MLRVKIRRCAARDSADLTAPAQPCNTYNANPWNTRVVLSFKLPTSGLKHTVSQTKKMKITNARTLTMPSALRDANTEGGEGDTGPAAIILLKVASTQPRMPALPTDFSQLLTYTRVRSIHRHLRENKSSATQRMRRFNEVQSNIMPGTYYQVFCIYCSTYVRTVRTYIREEKGMPWTADDK